METWWCQLCWKIPEASQGVCSERAAPSLHALVQVYLPEPEPCSLLWAKWKRQAIASHISPRGPEKKSWACICPFSYPLSEDVVPKSRAPASEATPASGEEGTPVSGGLQGLGGGDLRRTEAMTFQVSDLSLVLLNAPSHQISPTTRV